MDPSEALFAPPREQPPPAEAVRKALAALHELGQRESARVVRVLSPLLERGGGTVPPDSLTAGLLRQLNASPAVPVRGFVGLSPAATNDALVLLYGATRCPHLLARMRERAVGDPSLRWALRSLAEQYPAVWG